MKLFKIVFVLAFAFLSVLVLAKQAAAQTVPTPVIRTISGGADNSFRYPKVVGWTAAGTEVLIYIDGTFADLAQTSGQGSLIFTYQPDKPLSIGKHTIMAVARDRTSLVLSAPTKMIPFTTKAPKPAVVPAPSLISPNTKTVTGFPKPLVTGLTVSGTRVHIYIDGVYNGKTGYLTHPSGTANFAYRPFLNLSVGEHTVWAVAEDAQHHKSQPSATLRFRIEPPMPAPTLFQPVVNKHTTYRRPFIVGLAKNGSRVQIFIDQKLNGEIKVKDHPSGTASFAYKPFVALASGKHIAWAVAFDERGKESRWSNIISFWIKHWPKPQTSAISETQAKIESKKEDQKTVEKMEPEIKVSPLKEEKTEKKEKEVQKQEKIENKKIQKQEKTESKEIQEQENQATSSQSAIDSLLEKLGIGKNEQATSAQAADTQANRTKINLVIFLVFLVGVIAWIFWVNRELVKERQAQKEKDDEQTQQTPPDKEADK